MLARLHIRILAASIHVVHLQIVLTCLILGITVLLTQFLLLIYEELLRTVIVHAAGRFMVALWHRTIVVILVI